MRIAIDDLQLEKLFVVYPGVRSCELDSSILVVPFSQDFGHLIEETR